MKAKRTHLTEIAGKLRIIASARPKPRQCPLLKLVSSATDRAEKPVNAVDCTDS